MPIEFWIPQAKNTHSEYVILIAFPLQQWLRERASVLRYTGCPTRDRTGWLADRCSVSHYRHILQTRTTHTLHTHTHTTDTHYTHTYTTHTHTLHTYTHYTHTHYTHTKNALN